MVTCRIAETEVDVAECQKLVLEVYQESGYVSSDKKETSTMPSAFSSAVTILVEKGNNLCGTISLVIDSVHGLPMDSMYNEELRSVREVYRCSVLAEVCQFAIKKTTSGSSVQQNLELSLTLLKQVVGYAQANQVQRLCFVVNPKHRRFYESMGAELIGEEKNCPYVNNAPALAYHVCVETAARSLG